MANNLKKRAAEIGDYMKNLGGQVQGAIDGAGDYMKNLGSQAVQNFTAANNYIQSQIKKGVGSAVQGAYDNAKPIAEGLQSFAGDVAGYVNDGLSYVKGLFGDQANTGSAPASDAGGTGNTWKIPDLNDYQSPTTYSDNPGGSGDVLLSAPVANSSGAGTGDAIATVAPLNSSGGTGVGGTGSDVTEKPSYEEWLAEQKGTLLDSNEKLIEAAKLDLDKSLEEAARQRSRAGTEANALYEKGKTTYGTNAEAMMSQGLTGGGYSEYLGGKNYEALANANIAARAAQNEAEQAASDKFNTYTKNILAENAKDVESLKTSITQNLLDGIYDADTAAAIWKSYGLAEDADFTAAMNAAAAEWSAKGKATLLATLMDYLTSSEGNKTRAGAEAWIRAGLEANKAVLSDAELDAILDSYFDDNGKYLGENAKGNYLDNIGNTGGGIIPDLTDPKTEDDEGGDVTWQDKIKGRLSVESWGELGVDETTLMSWVDEYLASEGVTEDSFTDDGLQKYLGEKYNEKKTTEITTAIYGATTNGKAVTDAFSESELAEIVKDYISKHGYNTDGIQAFIDAKYTEKYNAGGTGDQKSGDTSLWNKIAGWTVGIFGAIGAVGAAGLDAILKSIDANNALTDDEKEKLKTAVGSTFTVEGLTFNKNSGRKDFTDGDNFSLVDSDGKKWRIQSAGAVSDDNILKELGEGTEGEVKARQGSLYVYTNNGVWYEIEARDVFLHGQYEKLWKKVYEDALEKGSKGELDSSGNEFTEDNAYTQGGAYAANIPNGTAKDGKGELKINLGGINYSVRAEGFIEETSTIYKYAFGDESPIDTNEVFLYGDTAYIKFADGVAKISGSNWNPGHYGMLIEKINDLKGNYNALAADKIDGVEIVTKDISSLKYNKNVKIRYGGKAYRFDVDAVMTGGDAFDAAKGLSQGDIFVHGNDVYLKGDDEVYRLGARDTFGTFSYGKFKKAIGIDELGKTEREATGSAPAGDGESGAGDSGSDGSPNTVYTTVNGALNEQAKAVQGYYDSNVKPYENEIVDVDFGVKTDIQSKGSMGDIFEAGGVKYKLIREVPKDSAEYLVSEGISGEGVTTPYNGIGSGKIYRYGDQYYFNDGVRTWHLERGADGNVTDYSGGGTIVEVPSDNSSGATEPKTAVTGGASYQKNTWGMGDLRKNDTFKAEVGGKTYNLRSDGEVSDSAIISAANDLSDGELFTLGDDQVYLKKGGKIYAVKGVNEKKVAGKIGSESEKYANATASGGKTQITSMSKIDAGSKTKIEVGDGDKYTVKIASVHGEDSAVYKAAENILDNSLFTYADELFLKRDGKIYELDQKGVKKSQYDELMKLANEKLEFGDLKTGGGITYDEVKPGGTIDVYLGTKSTSVTVNGEATFPELKESAKGYENGTVFNAGDKTYVKWNGKIYNLKYNKEVYEAIKDGKDFDGTVTKINASVPTEITQGSINESETLFGTTIIITNPGNTSGNYVKTKKGEKFYINANGENYVVNVDAVDKGSVYSAATDAKLEDNTVFVAGGVIYVYKTGVGAVRVHATSPAGHTAITGSGETGAAPYSKYMLGKSTASADGDAGDYTKYIGG